VSSNTPFGPSDGFDRPGQGNPEYLGSGAPGGEESAPKRWSVLGAAALGVAAVVALGGWGAYSFLSGGGAQPAAVLPAGTVAYASLDLDPSASQKIEAFKILKKFPGLQKELGLNTSDDLRRLFFEQVKEDGGCEGLDYAADIEPWIGERMAVAAVPDDKPGFDVPVFALQVSDRDAARAGIEAFADCVGIDEGFGFAFTGDYVLVTGSEARAKAVAADAEAGSLADDAGFQDWTGQIGDQGIITMYAAPGAPGYLGDLQDEQIQRSYEGDDSAELMAESEHADGTSDEWRSVYADFTGMAFTVRFDDGSVEAEFAAQGLPAGISSADGNAGPDLATLPASTGAALTIGLPDGWLDSWLETIAGFMGSGESVDEMLADAEADTGLELPEDIETLLGDGVGFSFDADADLETLFDAPDLTQVPAGLRVAGDPDAIMPVVDKIRAWVGPEADDVVVEPGDGVVGFGLNPAYVEKLVGDGSLGDEAAFQKVLPHADEATSALYVNFDAGSGWAEQIADVFEVGDLGGEGQKGGDVSDNVAPLDALGASTWVDGATQRGLLRLTTD
jgi:Protein of unknown function (DUF3352)